MYLVALLLCLVDFKSFQKVYLPKIKRYQNIAVELAVSRWKWLLKQSVIFSIYLSSTTYTLFVIAGGKSYFIFKRLAE
jgi:hypothetical protein